MPKIQKTAITMSPQEKIINQIRADLGIGVEVPELVSSSLHSTLATLSKDLYAKPVHFILELIQNAEDNTYQPDHSPKLVFRLWNDEDRFTGGVLLVVNNEEGFNENNVRALCAVGKTTKSKKEGYIGEKGIGFKSVFVVSSQPHIFSSGYQFCFREEQDPDVHYGFIIPYWVDAIPLIASNGYSNQTCILLPLKPEKTEIVEQELTQIAPETILFLKKLRAIQVIIGDEVVTNVHRVDDPRLPTTQLIAQDGKKRSYWISKTTVDVPDAVREESRSEIYTREIVLAFPLDKATLPDINVYAFLPTSSGVRSGLDFLVNADFLLSANREQIHEDREWNIWLRDNISMAFWNGFTDMLDHASVRYQAYSFIPLEKKDRIPFFESVVSDILDKLGANEIVITDQNDRVLPSNARFASKDLRKLLAGRVRPAQLRLTPLVADCLQTSDFQERLRGIGVRDLSKEEIIKCLGDQEWLKSKKIEWFLSLYRYLSEQKWATPDALQSLCVLPTTHGLVSRKNGSGIYLPSDVAENTQKKHSSIIKFANITYLDARLWKELQKDPELLNWVVNTFNLFESTIDMICKELAIHANEMINTITINNLMDITRFICDHIDSLGENQQRVIRNHLPLILSDGKISEPKNWSLETPLVFPENFNSVTGWSLVFPSPVDREHMAILSNLYLEGAHKENRPRWEKLFRVIGATPEPYPPKRKISLSYGSKQDIPEYLYAWFKGYNLTSADLTDWTAPSWLSINSEPKSMQIKRSGALVNWLEVRIINIPSESSGIDWTKALLKWFYYCNRCVSNVSSFYHSLNNSAWVPTSKGFCRPNEVFVDRPEIRDFFGDTVPYLKLKMSDKLLAWLKIRQTMTTEEMLGVLRNLASKVPQKTDISLIRRLYTFLKERWSTDLKSIFYNESLILVTQPTPRWLTAQQVIWTDREDVFGDAFGYLEPDYHKDLYSFFVDLLDIREDADDELYLQAWENLVAQKPGTLTDEDVERTLSKIYPVVLSIAKRADKPDGWNAFCSSVRLWTSNNCFAKPSSVFIPDDRELVNVFNGMGVHYVWLPGTSTYTSYLPLLDALRVKRLSDEIKLSISKNHGQPVIRDQNQYLTNTFKKAVCTYLYNELPETYQQLKDSQVLERFLRTREYVIEKLQIEYQLPGKPSRSNSGRVFWDIDSCALYLVEDGSEEEWSIEIPSLLAHELKSKGDEAKSFENFIGRIMVSPESSVVRLLKKNGSEIDPEEVSWIDILLHENIESHDDLPAGGAGEESGDGHQVIEIRPKGAISKPDEPKSGGGSGFTKRDSGKTDKKDSPPGKGVAKFKTYAYVTGSHDSEDNGGTNPDHRREIDQRGMHLVMSFERDNGRTPQNMNTEKENHPGYDIVSREDDLIVRYIEVKSTSYVWDQRGVLMSDTQVDAARKLGKQYWLYIVEASLSDHPRLIMIQDPCNKIQNFVFDSGWQALAEFHAF